MTMFHNNNGKTYHILDAWESYVDGKAAVILADYGNKDKSAIQAGAEPIQYIVATFYNIKDLHDRKGSWSYGKYYPGNYDGLKQARAYLAEIAW